MPPDVEEQADGEFVEADLVDDAQARGRRAQRSNVLGALRYCALVFVVVRIGLFVVALLSVAVLPANAPAKVPGIATPAVTHTWSVMFTAWERWDALWYLRIVSHGYASGDGSAAFFPGYPLAVRDAAWLTGGHPLLGAYLVSSIALIVGLTLVYLLTEFEFDRDLARRTVVLMCVFPTSFFFFAPYSESLFLAFAVGALFAARRSLWVLATILAAGASATRNIGVVVGLAITVESLRQTLAVRESRRALVRGAARTLGVGAGSLLGIASYLAWWRWHAHNAAIPFKSQGGWQRHFRLPWVSLWDGVHEGLRWIGIYSGGYQLIDLLLVAIALGGGVWAVARTPLVYRVYTAASLIAPLCLVFVARPFMSMPRFMLVVFPVFWAFAQFTRRFRAWNAVIATSAAGLGMLSLLFVNWYWVY